ncbi:MAG TPA: LptA/OstA family protein [Hyphomonadaceae bacterium]|nr:LptA/OstA family protein [Hyphomonadaceae bacterium]
MKKLAGTLAAAIFLAAAPAHAQVGSGQDVLVVADKFDFFQKEGRSVYTGNVQATQGESMLTTDKLTSICSRAAPPPGEDIADQPCEEIRQLVAENNVLYTAPKLKIKGDRAEYDYPSDTITITGDVILMREKEALIRGTKVVYQVSAGLANISAGNDRVTGILTPQRSNRANSAAPAPAQPPARPN